MKILITGGHMAPALALIQALPEDVSVVYVGRKYPFEGDKGLSLEYTIITSLGIPFIELKTGRLQRKVTKHTFNSVIKIPGALFKSLSILSKEKPDVVMGFGGYLSVPIGVAARALGIPTVIHEQTFNAGLANSFLTKFATKICISWEQSKAFFPTKKIVVTGNPLVKPATSRNVHDFLPKSKDKVPLILVSGGSAGSHAINTLVENSLPSLLEKYCIIHQTGDAKEYGDFDRLLELSSKLPEKLRKRYLVTHFIDPSSMEELVKKADLVISRSGINTITLLIALEKKAILIPLPYGQKDEQLINARFLKEMGLGEILPQDIATSSRLENMISEMLLSKDYHLVDMSIKQLHRDAAEKIYEVLKLCTKKESSKESGERF